MARSASEPYHVAARRGWLALPGAPPRWRLSRSVPTPHPPVPHRNITPWTASFRHSTSPPPPFRAVILRFGMAHFAAPHQLFHAVISRCGMINFDKRDTYSYKLFTMRQHNLHVLHGHFSLCALCVSVPLCEMRNHGGSPHRSTTTSTRSAP